jgi:hypothetical protein
MTDAEKDAIWTVLVKEAGAEEGMRTSFKLNWPECREYRFCGSLGFGGKVWYREHDGNVSVSCYQEDETPKRIETIARTNAALRAAEAEGA